MAYARDIFVSTGRFDALLIPVAAWIAAFVSVAIQGFSYGENNIYHIPFVLDWMSDPAFSSDSFIASLKNFVSGAWVVIRLFATEDNVEGLFFLLHVVTRWATLVALIFAASSLNITGSLPRLILLIVFASTPLLRGVTAVGEGEIFIPYFTHTELTHPFVIASVALMARKQIALSFALTGVIFDINAFIAVWVGGALLVAAAVMGSYRIVQWRDLMKQASIGLVSSAIVALPVAWWIFSILSSQNGSLSFDYIDYLRSYWPDHFLISAATPRELLNFAAVLIAGFIGLQILGATALVWAGAFLGFLLVFLVGVALPEVTSSPPLLNLHLLRVDSELQLLAVLFIGAIGVARLRDPDAFTRLSAVGALALLAIPIHGGIVPAAVLLLAADRHVSKHVVVLATIVSCAFVAVTLDYTWRRQVMFGAVEIGVVIALLSIRNKNKFVPAVSPNLLFVAVALIFIASAALSFHDQRAVSTPRLDAMRQVAEWGKKNTASQSVFLIPPDRGASIFQIFSRRVVWVDWKRGAAVMWMPSYYPEWSTRLAEVRALSSLEEKVAYACRNQIDYVVNEKAAPGQILEHERISFENGYYVVVDAKASC